MQKLIDLDTFYGLLRGLENRIGGRRRLGDCHGRMQWPVRGVYFFFEKGECRSGDSNTPRVVRVGTHALTSTSKAKFWKRLGQHRGSLNPYGGNHRGSVFRELSGLAMMNRNPELFQGSWGRSRTAPRNVRQAERPLEEKVSDYLGDMTLIFLPVLDNLGKDGARHTTCVDASFYASVFFGLRTCARRLSASGSNWQRSVRL